MVISNTASLRLLNCLSIHLCPLIRWDLSQISGISIDLISLKVLSWRTTLIKIFRIWKWAWIRIVLISPLNWVVFRFIMILTSLQVFVSSWLYFDNFTNSGKITINGRVKVWWGLRLNSFIWSPSSDSHIRCPFSFSCRVRGHKFLPWINLRFFQILISQSWNLWFNCPSILNH